MPVMDGDAALIEILKINPDLLVITFTSSALNKSGKLEIVDSLTKGYYDYLVKPYSIVQVEEIISYVEHGVICPAR